MYFDDREGVFGFAFQHPWIALVLVFAIIYGVSTLMPKLGGAALSWVWDAIKGFLAWLDNRGSSVIPPSQVPTATQKSISADAALASAQQVLAYAVKSGDSNLLATAMTLFPVLQSAGKEIAK